MYPRELIMKFKVIYKVVSDNFYFDHNAVQSNLTVLLFLNPMNKLKIMVFNFMAILLHFQILHHP